MSAALEAYALDRRIFGFHTLEGFLTVSEKDIGAANAQREVSGLSSGYDVHAELLSLIDEYDERRSLNQFDKVFLVGNVC